jgi:hypothetical protein
VLLAGRIHVHRHEGHVVGACAKVGARDACAQGMQVPPALSDEESDLGRRDEGGLGHSSSSSIPRARARQKERRKLEPDRTSGAYMAVNYSENTT